MADVEDAFVSFMDRVPFYGAVTACVDDERLRALLPRARRRVYTYGLSPEADFVARLLPTAEGVRSRFEVVAEGRVLGVFELHVPGRHNVLNATAAVAIGTELEIAPEAIAEGLRGFRGVDRRFQVKGQARGVTVVDDYGHHPTEIRATLQAARECGYARVHVIFQPHRYTRTRDLLEEFAGAFEAANSVQVLDIYAASEEPIPGITAGALVERMGRDGVRFAGSFEDAARSAAGQAREGDVVLTLGAGSVAQAAGMVLERLAG
jgi:UDP-N-acetylmuramate--alanine ligase